MHGVHDWNLEMPTFSPSYDPRDHAEISAPGLRVVPDFVCVHMALAGAADSWRRRPQCALRRNRLLVDALRRQQVDFEELVFPDEIHDFLLRRDWVHAYSAGADFFNRKLAK